MKCYVVKDLLPNYVEKLTSDETNADIKTHLEGCDSCREAYEVMIKPAEPVNVINENANKKNVSDVKYLKKIKKKNIIKIMLAVTAAIVICSVLFVIGGTLVLKQIVDNKPDYGIVAYNITNDNAYGPSVYDGEVYFPISEDANFPDSNNSAAIGYFGFIGEKKPDMFYKLFIENCVYLDETDATNEYVKIRGANFIDLRKASVIEAEMDLSKYENFYIFDEDWLDQTAFSVKGAAGTEEMELETVKALEDEFGMVEYNEKDFEEYDAFCTIKAYKLGESENSGSMVFPDTVGCIMVSDGNYYYGNKENQITGDLLEKIQNLVEHE